MHASFDDFYSVRPTASIYTAKLIYRERDVVRAVVAAAAEQIKTKMEQKNIESRK